LPLCHLLLWIVHIIMGISLRYYAGRFRVFQFVLFYTSCSPL
jgi:hypothetical protein